MDYRLPLLAQGPISFLTLSNLFSANRLRHGIAIIDESIINFGEKVAKPPARWIFVPVQRGVRPCDRARRDSLRHPGLLGKEAIILLMTSFVVFLSVRAYMRSRFEKADELSKTGTLE